jgi:hypothetical protein
MLKKDILYFLSFDFSLKKSKKEISFERFRKFMLDHHDRKINRIRYQVIKNSI